MSDKTKGEIAQMDTKKLRELAKKATPVVAWYPHNTEVRGPFCRWFTCSEVASQYRKEVAETWDDCNFAAAAMNSLVPLLDELESLRKANGVMWNALQSVTESGHVDCEECNSHEIMASEAIAQAGILEGKAT